VGRVVGRLSLQFGDIIRTIFLQLTEAKWTRLFAISASGDMPGMCRRRVGMELIDTKEIPWKVSGIWFFIRNSETTQVRWPMGNEVRMLWHRIMSSGGFFARFQELNKLPGFES
jgi:hypothetical protein